MDLSSVKAIPVENISLRSSFLQRNVIIDLYLPLHIDQLTHADLLLINDGQDMKEMGLVSILENYTVRDPFYPW
jgi:enterochelin esterase-like enzyme